MTAAVHSIVKLTRGNARERALYASHTPPPSLPDGRNIGHSARRIRRAGRSYPKQFRNLTGRRVFAASASSAFAHGWIDERAATTGQTGLWSEAVAYNPATQTAELEGDVVFTPYAPSAGNFVTLKGVWRHEMRKETTELQGFQAALATDANCAALVEEYKLVASQFKGKKKEEPAPEPEPEASAS